MEVRMPSSIWLRNSLTLVVGILVCLSPGAWSVAVADDMPGATAPAGNWAEIQAFRGPTDVALLPAGWCVVANELTSTLSLVDLTQGRVVDEHRCGDRPLAVAALGADELLVSCHRAGTVERFKVSDNRLIPLDSIRVGYDPLGLVVHSAGRKAFVGLQATGEVAQLAIRPMDDTEEAGQRKPGWSLQLERRFPAGPWPRYLTLSADESRLVVGCSGDGTIAVHDVSTGEQLYAEGLSGGINLGHMLPSQDGQYVYFPWMVYRSNPITEMNVQRGWVLASRLGRVRLDGPSYREAISLDVPRRAMADVHGIATNADQTRLVITSSGTQELLIYRLQDLPFVGTGGPGDLIDGKLLRDNDLFYRMKLGGRPLAVRHLDSHHFVIANHTLDQLQIVDIQHKRIDQTISLGRAPESEEALLAHRGMQLFHDATHSLDQWYSCASCHLDGGSNARAMDTWNDGTELTPKTVLPLVAVTETAPWTWHGWQGDLRDSISKSFTETMLGPRVSAQDIAAMESYLASLKPISSPFRNEDGSLSDAAERGRALFHNAEVGCSNCHSGPHFSDGQIHDVGLGSPDDHYHGYNTPTLLGVYRKVRFLHDGRAKSLERVLTRYHRSDEIGGGKELSKQEVDDLVEYLKSL
jgi:cytochrome c peroxidase/DNA-binding beta-propeller fold protein YncE